jgi:hypothetical protein
VLLFASYKSACAVHTQVPHTNVLTQALLRVWLSQPEALVLLPHCTFGCFCCRPDTKDTIEKAMEYGVDVKMITGGQAGWLHFTCLLWQMYYQHSLKWHTRCSMSVPLASLAYAHSAAAAACCVCR